MLDFRRPSEHAQCTTCFNMNQVLRQPGVAIADKLHIMGRLREHYKEQYLDRCVYWALRSASRRSRPPPSPTSPDVLCIIVDSMDKSKFGMPRFPFGRISKDLAKHPRPRLVCTSAVAHGFATCIYLADEAVVHGADACCEVIARTLEHVARICAAEGRPMPSHLVIQSDNAPAQAKNACFVMFLANLVAKYKFQTTSLTFLIVGHTHEDVGRAAKPQRGLSRG